MFRATCDKRVTTSPPRQPTNSKPAHLEMPAGQPHLHQTRPRQPAPLPHNPAPAAHRAPSRHPLASASPTPCGTGRVFTLRQLGASRSVAPHTDSPPPTPTCRRSRPAPPTQHAHQPSPCQPTTATNTESSFAAPRQPRAGPASHRPNIDPHRPVNHIQTADFPRRPLTARYCAAAARHHQRPRTRHSLA
jgi:hypothetical protein